MFFLAVIGMYTLIKVIAHFESRDLNKARKIAQDPSLNRPAPVRKAEPKVKEKPVTSATKPEKTVAPKSTAKTQSKQVRAAKTAEPQKTTSKRKKNILIIDTETTGLDSKAEIVQLSVIDFDGNEVVDTLIRPFHAIPPEATNIHGITNEMVNATDVPTIVHAILFLLRAVQEKFPDGDFKVVGYNTPFDTKMIQQSLSISKRKLQRKTDKTLSDEEKLNLPDVVDNLKGFISAIDSNSRCIMREYQDYTGNHRWIKLVEAAAECNVQVKNAHSAKGDCLMTLGIMKYIDRT